MKIGALIQARLSSTRWPRKCIEAEIFGQKMIDRVYDLVAGCKVQTHVIIPDNEPDFTEYLTKKKIPFLLGSATDLLSRYAESAKILHLDGVIRVTADCPFLNQDILALLAFSLKIHLARPELKNKNILVSNVFRPLSYPDGWDIEGLSMGALQYLDEHVLDPADREHVTQAVYRNPEKFPFYYDDMRSPINLSFVKCSIDTKEDLKNVKDVYLMG